MKKTLIVLMAVISATTIVLSGCNSKTDPGSQEGTTTNQAEQSNQGDSDQKDDGIIKGFEDLVAQKDKSPEDLRNFMQDNTSKVSKEAMSEMIMGTEKVQKEFIAELEEMYFAIEIQEKFQTQFKDGFMPNNLGTEEVTDIDLKSLLEKTIPNGYRLETAEGMYFPIIDYSAYKDFAPFATEDIKSYLSIMEKESAKVPAKDAALVISWGEIVERALAQESFLKTYPDSRRTDEVKNLFKNYKTFTFFGLNNTPLFDYSTKSMDEDAKETYKQVVEAFKKDEKSDYVNQIALYMEVLAKNGYKLNTEVDTFRKDIDN